MPEKQDVEYKQNWHDDYLKTICAFANTTGGTLFVGKDDKGKIVNVNDYKKLMEDIPNKIRNHLGITAETNLNEENNNYYIQIVVPAYSNAISLRGRYYKRIGSTTLELTGNSLNDFLLSKSGKTWDDIIEDRATLDDINQDSISTFLRAAKKSDRLPDTEGLTKIQLLQKLRLAEGEKIKRAAIILFGKDPGKFYPNTSVKIGRFGKAGDDLKFQEVEEGNLFHLLKETTDQLNRKFFTKPIDFEGLQRIERGEYPVGALREMLLNALVHKDYAGSTIQIKMYDDRFNIWNEGTLPPGLTIDDLKGEHPSKPRNPVIADVCFKGGYIDSWGSGTLKIIEACIKAELPEPEIMERHGGFSVTIFKDRFTEEQLNKIGLNERQIKAVKFVKENSRITNKEYRNLAELSDEGARLDLNDLLEKGVLESKGKGRGVYYILKSLGD